MNYSNIKKFDISNGVGVRTSLFVSGCTRHCIDCFNSEAWDFKAGKEFTQDTMNDILESLKPDYVDGLSILGGEPLEPENRSCVINIIENVQNKYPDKKIWLYSGFTWEELWSEVYATYEINLFKIMHSIDILVDGPFDAKKKDLLLRFRGSSNQRIIDVKESIKCQKIILWHDYPEFESHKSYINK